ncbi:FadR/GntR family transcriptional regulator [Litorimonas sp. RW-G-Af-16]|uniref:FadR/GntR family transcriptional regulator n=1 Tax=Litorimonas sp. RW-G-Af-16 TaxID=3241168 RepID=UPI00390C8861
MAHLSLYADLADKIQALIDTQVIAIGSLLPSEYALANRFGVSRHAVRKAKDLLSEKGRITIQKGESPLIIDPGKAYESQQSETCPAEITEAQLVIASEAAALAAPYITDEEILALKKYNGIIYGEVKSEMSPYQAECAFFACIAKATKNHAIIRIVNRLWTMRSEAWELHGFYKNICHEFSGPAQRAYQAVIQALEHRDSRAARSLIRNHFAHVLDTVLVAAEEEAYKEAKRKTSELRSKFVLAHSFAP